MMQYLVMLHFPPGDGPQEGRRRSTTPADVLEAPVSYDLEAELDRSAAEDGIS